MPDPTARWLALQYNTGTRRQYRQVLCSLAAVTGGDILTLTPDQAAAWMAAQATALAPATAQTRWSTARTFYRWTVDEGLIAADPFLRVRRPTGSRMPRGRALTYAEAQVLWDAARERSTLPERDLALFEVALRCGLRRAELAGLTWSQVLLSADPPHVLVIGKGNKQRPVKLQPPTVAALIEWKSLLNGRGGPNDPVFDLTGSGIYKLVVRRVHDAGIPHASPHDFRRTFITRALDANAKFERVQEAAGHVSPATTRLYDKARRALQDAPGDYLDWEL